jgi:hypothetical protein
MRQEAWWSPAEKRNDQIIFICDIRINLASCDLAKQAFGLPNFSSAFLSEQRSLLSLVGPGRPITKLDAEMHNERSARRAGTAAHHPMAGIAGKEPDDRFRPCTVFERLWRLLGRLCEVERSGTESSRRKQISTAFPSRAARREQPFRPCAPDFRVAPARDMCPGGWPRFEAQWEECAVERQYRERLMSRRLETAGKINARNPNLVCGRRLGVPKA